MLSFYWRLMMEQELFDTLAALEMQDQQERAKGLPSS